jgi:cell division protein FtsQ
MLTVGGARLTNERIPVIRPDKKQSRSSRKLLFFLFFFFFIVLLILFFQSSISRIATIEIRGNQMVSSEEIGQASGLKTGDHFFGFRSSAVIQRIQALPAVKSATVSKKFPGLIVLEIKEHQRVAFQYSAEGQLEAVLANGYIIPVHGSGIIVDKPVLTGWEKDDPWKLKLCQALAGIADSKLSFLSEIRPEPTVSYPDKVKIYTRSRYEVFTTITYLPEKMDILYALIDEMKQKKVDSGVFELLEVDVHKPFNVYYDSLDDSKLNSTEETTNDRSGGTVEQKQQTAPPVKPAGSGQRDSRNL